MFRTGADTPAPVLSAQTPPRTGPVISSTSTPASEYESELLGWINMAVREGEALLMNESEHEDTEENMRIALGHPEQGGQDKDRPFYRSTYSMNRIGKNIDDLASAITDFRPIGQFKTYNHLYDQQASILDKLMTAWWYNMDIDLKMLLLVKQSLIERTSYAQLVFNPTCHNNLGDLDIVIRSYKDVLPIRPNSKTTIQDAVGIIIRSKNTVNWGRSRYSDKAHLIQANNEGSQARQWASKSMTSSPILDYLERNIARKKTDFAIPTYDHYEIYVRDGSVNSSGERKWVGPGPAGDIARSPWGYWVEPCKPLYPRGRLIVVANLTTVLFDGGNPYWHGMFPIIKLTLNPSAFSFLGKSAICDAKSPHKQSNELLRGITDACRKALKPGVIVDKQAVNRQVLENFDTSDFGWKLRTNPSAGQGIIIEPPPVLPAYILETRAECNQTIDHVMGILDMRALAQLKQLGGDTNVEQLLENLGPSIRTRGRVLEVFLREVGQMMRANFFQFYTMPRRVEILGDEGMDFEDFDFDPGSLIPAFSPQQFQESFGESAENEMSRFGPESSRADRAMEHIKSFCYFITPNSLLSLAKTQDKLMYMQLFSIGIIDPITLLEKLEVPNIGVLSGEPKTILERMAAAAQNGYTGAVSAAGRKSTYQQMPELRPDGKMSTSG